MSRVATAGPGGRSSRTSVKRLATPSSAPGYGDGFPAPPIPVKRQIPASGKTRQRGCFRAPRRAQGAVGRCRRRIVSRPRPMLPRYGCATHMAIRWHSPSPATTCAARPMACSASKARKKVRCGVGLARCCQCASEKLAVLAWLAPKAVGVSSRAARRADFSAGQSLAVVGRMSMGFNAAAFLNWPGRPWRWKFSCTLRPASSRSPRR